MRDTIGQDRIVPVGVILAGGLSRRMEGPEKSLLQLDGISLIERVAERLGKQTDEIIINANGDAARFSHLRKPVEADTVPGFAGPLAGILTGMRWCETKHPAATHIVTVAADTPFFPKDLLARFTFSRAEMLADAESEIICLARSGENRHPVFGLWPVAIADALERFLTDENERKVMLFVKRYTLAEADFALHKTPEGEFDPFFNINTPDDFDRARQILKRQAA